MRRSIDRWIQRVWYGGDAGYRLLLPLSAIYWLIVSIRRMLYGAGMLRPQHPGVPVVVVGNITAGGTGKTPTVIWLAQCLEERGFKPGIVSRGYGGSKSSSPMRVDAASDPAIVGDEPVLLVRRSQCPVVVDRDRVRAARMLVEDGVDVVIADDGMQHWKLARDYEICVIDGRRGLGNRFVLPAGPLRETASRLADVDQVLVNGRPEKAPDTAIEQNAIRFRLVARDVNRLNGSVSRPIAKFSGQTVHAVAAIGNPTRFFDLLRQAGMQVIEHGFPDHANIDPAMLDFGDGFDILLTEKDAVKIGTRVSDRFWYVPVDVAIDPLDAGPFLEQIESRLRNVSEPS